MAKQVCGGDRETVRTCFGSMEGSSLIESKIRALSEMRDEIAQVVTILRSCQSCGRDVLLDAKSCADCAYLASRESLPETFEVILS